jgi:hypothetical protein
MNQRLSINKEHQIEELREYGGAGLNAAVRIAAKIISYIFHPVFVPVYLVYFMIYIHPYLFAGDSAIHKREVLIMSLVSFMFFPLVTVGLLRALKFISSVQLKTRQDRIIPLVACGVWYFWIWYVWHNLPMIPKEMALLGLASWISVSLALMANVIMKISLHAISLGVMLMCMLLMGFSGELAFGLYISIALFITGLVCTARFIDSDHTAAEIYGGLALGMLTTGIVSLLS